MISLIPVWAKALILAALVALATLAVHAYNESLREDGRAEVRAEWAQDREKQKDAAIKEAAKNAEETARRLAQQQENQIAQNKELELARAAADRNARDAERVRKQAANASDQWSHTLRNSPTSADLAAAADAIRVLTDVRGRLDAHASVLAGYATAAHLAGLKCERDYDALSASRSPISSTTER